VTGSSLSVVIPVRNEAAHLPATIETLLAALEGSGFEAELVLVDDGSTDGSADAARAAVAGRLPLRVVSQANRGRFEARRTGLELATGEWALLIDGRVRIDPQALAYAREHIERGQDVWTADVDVQVDGNPYGAFWKLLAELAWNEYFDDPHETSFGVEEFDRFPKGTTCFLAPRELMLEASASFRSHYAAVGRANDDTPLLRWIAARRPIHVSPGFGCTYRPRTTLRAFLRHSLHRGVVFVDGHGRRESRFFPVVVAFFPVSALLAVATARRPLVLPAALMALSGAAASFGVLRRRTPFEIVSLAVLTPVYALAHGTGMWQGLALLVRNRL
jgi:glycosyltransferase involved in cell wall biosynthesis